jgi:hypothetical protein
MMGLWGCGLFGGQLHACLRLPILDETTESIQLSIIKGVNTLFACSPPPAAICNTVGRTVLRLAWVLFDYCIVIKCDEIVMHEEGKSMARVCAGSAEGVRTGAHSRHFPGSG